MPIKLQCDCGKWLRVPDEAAGRRARCPACGQLFTVPAVSIEPMAVLPVSENDPYDVVEDSDLAAKAAADRAAAQARANARRSASQVAPRPLRDSIRPKTTAEPGEAVFYPPKIDLVGALPPPPTQRAVLQSEVGKTTRPYRYLLLLLALMPLAWSTFHRAPEVDIQQRLEQTLDGHPDNIEKFNALPEHSPKQEVFATLPDDKLKGALLAYDTYVHWGFAALSGISFLALVLLLFPPGHTRIWHLLIVSVFTGTAGILLLLGFQWIAFHMGFIIPRGILGILFDIVAFIGWSYSVALGHDSGFLLSALGFTAGVGFCEESCKALPLIWKARTDGFYSWRSAMIWGLVSGVGFGVSEGVTYSHDFYNGIDGGQIYLIRFISCVALHGIWAAATGINIFRRQDHFRGQLHVLEWLLQILITVIVPMVLHGFYDTLLKQGYNWGALGIALASFGWLAYQIELAKRKLDKLPAGYAA